MFKMLRRWFAPRRQPAPSSRSASCFRPALESLEDRQLMAAGILASVAAKPIETVAAKVSTAAIAESSMQVIQDIQLNLGVYEAVFASGGGTKDGWFWGPGGGLSGTPAGEFSVIHKTNTGGKEVEDFRLVVTGMKWGDTYLGQKWNDQNAGAINLGHGTDLNLPGGGLGGRDQDFVSGTDGGTGLNQYGGVTSESADGSSRIMKDAQGRFREIHQSSSDGTSSGSAWFDEQGNSVHLDYRYGYLTSIKIVSRTGAEIQIWKSKDKLPAPDDSGGGSNDPIIVMKGSSVRPIAFPWGEVDPFDVDAAYSGISRYDGLSILAKTGGDDGAREKQEPGPISMEAAMAANFYTDPPRDMVSAIASASAEVSMNK